MDQREQESAKASDTKAISDVDMLVELVRQRRDELGIRPGSSPPQVTAAMPSLELSAEENAARDEAAKRMAVAEQLSRRQGMYAVLCERAGERYRGCDFRNFVRTNQKQEDAMQACREFADTLPERLIDRNNLVLYGPVGTGKDHLAFAVCGYAIFSHGKYANWVNGQTWFGEIRDEMGDSVVSERSLIARLTAPDVLVVSDPLPPMGALTQHQSVMLYRLIDGRYSAGKVTIVTVNVKDDAEADTRLGAPTWDRICDGAWKLFCNWASYRKPARVVNVR